MAISTDELAKATTLTRAGRLMEATRSILAALGARPAAMDVKRDPQPHDWRDVDEAPVAAAFEEPSVRDAPAEVQLPLLPAPAKARTLDSSFTLSNFRFDNNTYRYRLFLPARAEGEPPLPVIVMLHGCKQNSEDFALGTSMNALAERDQVIVVYPEQLRKANSMGCWNWFEPGHQQRGAGEAAMIAALVSDVARRHGGDASRIYVAGLSAGGAMAANLGSLYPDVFAAVGIHSGLPAGAADSVTSAFGAMRRGVGHERPQGAVPTIVFHGSNDKTVAARNGDVIASGQLAAWSASGIALVASEQSIDGARTATRTTWADAQGSPKLELWRVDGGPHAWSGGDSTGSFTDPQGPSASEAMLKFFLQHRGAAPSGLQ